MACSTGSKLRVLWLLVTTIDSSYATRLLDALPAAAFVVDVVGTVLFATPSAASMVGREVEEMVGRSVLELVNEDTAWAYASAVAMAEDYPDVVMGPLRIVFRHANGQERCADVWASNHLDDPAIGGIVCLLAPEMAATRLAEAVGSLAADAPFEDIAASVALAMHGAPVVTDAAVLRPHDGVLAVVAAHVVPPDLLEAVCAEPAWLGGVGDGARVVQADLADLDVPWRGLALDAGYQAVWAEPVAGPDGDHAVILLWRRHTGTPSPNQLSSIFEAAGILSLSLRLQRAASTST